MRRKIFKFLNPLSKLGTRSYSMIIPFVGMLLMAVVFEILYSYISPNILGLWIIFVSIALIVYFSFRDGLPGGLTASVLTITYYFYIIYSRNYTGAQKLSGIETTVALGLVYLTLSFTIGWLKQTIDNLIIKEEDEKIRLRTIIQQLPVGIIITDKDGRVTETNKMTVDLLGKKLDKDFIIGKDNLENIEVNGKKIKPSESPLHKALKTNRPFYNKELMITKDGRTKYLQVSSIPIHNKKGEIIAATSTIYDFTFQKELEDRKDDFINMASHELKTPLTSMKLYTSSLADRIKRSDKKESIKILKNIEYQSARIQELVNTLLDVSRFQLKKVNLSNENFDISLLIKDIIESLKVTEGKKIIFTNKLQINVFADRFRIYQVVTNLLTNAIKYSPRNSKIIIKVIKIKKEIQVSVQDFGIGISKHEQKRVFDRLYQVNDSNEKTFPGFGMGLYISKEIISRHHGRIWVESEKGKGSTFYFALPVSYEK